MYHFFTLPENIDENAGTVRISGPDVNHIRNVLRMKPGEQLLVSDGEGTDFTCSIPAKDDMPDQAQTDDSITLRIISSGGTLSEPSVRFYLFQGLPKADKFEHIIQKSVELGVYEIIPVRTERCIVKYDDKKARSKNERWQKISESAAKQSRRGIVPEVGEIMPFSKALEKAAQLDLVLIPYENFKDMNATKETLSRIRPGMSVGIFVGPEGGFAENEIKLANEHGAVCISLGSRILRTETAPLMLLSVLTFALEGQKE